MALQTIGEAAAVLAQHRSADGRVTWQARVSGDRGRLQVVAVVAPSTEPTVVELLTDAELRELLNPKRNEPWACDECGLVNEPGACWCRRCSNHLRGVVGEAAVGNSQGGSKSLGNPLPETAQQLGAPGGRK